MAKQELVIIFDFDKTIIEFDSDDWIICNLGLTHLFNSLLFSMPYISLMDRMMEELHSKGTTLQDIANCLIKLPLSPKIINVIKSAYASGCDLRIVSDSNTSFIEIILKHHGVFECFSEINTNFATTLEDGRLKITPFYDFKSYSHGCNRCPPNLCKGMVLKRIQASCLEKRIIYVGDGINDYCPSLKLKETDYVMPRKHYSLRDEINKNPSLLKASILEWEDGEQLGTNLINLITSLIVIDCKSDRGAA